MKQIHGEISRRGAENAEVNFRIVIFNRRDDEIIEKTKRNTMPGGQRRKGEYNTLIRAGY